MNDLVRRLRKLSGPEYPEHICGKLQMDEAATRIEALEAALWKAMDAQLRLVSVYSSSHDSDTRFSAWEQSKASVAAINDLLKD
jgi:hypothetical protein